MRSLLSSKYAIAILTFCCLVAFMGRVEASQSFEPSSHDRTVRLLSDAKRCARLDLCERYDHIVNRGAARPTSLRGINQDGEGDLTLYGRPCAPSHDTSDTTGCTVDDTKAT